MTSPSLAEGRLPSSRDRPGTFTGDTVSRLQGTREVRASSRSLFLTELKFQTIALWKWRGRERGRGSAVPAGHRRRRVRRGRAALGPRRGHAGSRLSLGRPGGHRPARPPFPAGTDPPLSPREGRPGPPPARASARLVAEGPGPTPSCGPAHSSGSRRPGYLGPLSRRDRRDVQFPWTSKYRTSAREDAPAHATSLAIGIVEAGRGG